MTWPIAFDSLAEPAQPRRQVQPVRDIQPVRCPLWTLVDHEKLQSPEMASVSCDPCPIFGEENTVLFCLLCLLMANPEISPLASLKTHKSQNGTKPYWGRFLGTPCLDLTGNKQSNGPHEMFSQSQETFLEALFQ